MKAAVNVPGRVALSIEDVTPAPLGPRDALVRVDASGVCRTDLSALQARSAGYDRAPVVLGHEGAGTVVEVGRDVRRCRVGDRVIASFVAACGECWFCIRGWSNHCEGAAERAHHAIIRSDGSRATTMAGLGTFAEVMTVHEDALVTVETELPSEQLALVGCGVTTGVGAVLWSAAVKPGATVAVLGLGGVGSFVVQGARIAGAARIMAVDPLLGKREHAMALGATDAVDPAEGDVVAQLRDLTAGRGVDYAFEVVGTAEAALTAYDSTRRKGTTVLLGKPPAGTTVTLPVDVLFRHEKRLIGSLYGSCRIREHFPVLVELAEQGRLDIASAISRRLPLDAINDAWGLLESGDVIRTVVTPAAGVAATGGLDHVSES